MKISPAYFVTELTKRKLTVAIAESMTCGLAMQELSKVKGTTEVLKGGIVCYDEQVKIRLMGIPAATITKYTAESQEVTNKLARKIRSMITADIHAAITGLAAPGGSETKDKPVGTVFFSVIFKGTLYTRRKLFRGNPQKIRKKACDELYGFIIKVSQPPKSSTNYFSKKNPKR